MKARLTFIEWLMRITGFGYVANTGTEEIHRLDCKHVNCQLALMRNKIYITRKQVLKLIHGIDVTGAKWNGCRWCFREKDTGGKLFKNKINRLGVIEFRPGSCLKCRQEPGVFIILEMN